MDAYALQKMFSRSVAVLNPSHREMARLDNLVSYDLARGARGWSGLPKSITNHGYARGRSKGKLRISYLGTEGNGPANTGAPGEGFELISTLRTQKLLIPQSRKNHKTLKSA